MPLCQIPTMECFCRFRRAIPVQNGLQVCWNESNLLQINYEKVYEYQNLKCPMAETVSSLYFFTFFISFIPKITFISYIQVLCVRQHYHPNLVKQIQVFINILNLLKLCWCLRDGISERIYEILLGFLHLVRIIGILVKTLDPVDFQFCWDCSKNFNST